MAYAPQWARHAAPQAAYHSRNRAKRLAYNKQWREENRERRAAYAFANRAQACAREATRRARLRAPKWADKAAIAVLYAACPAGCHVDHIIPLRGRRVSGLHVLENLQYLPAIENICKGNRYEH